MKETHQLYMKMSEIFFHYCSEKATKVSVDRAENIRKKIFNCLLLV